jgi:AcrR family transcriptional regulator
LSECGFVYSFATVMETTDISVKEHIIQTATRLFHEQGYNRTGINQVIEEAGVAKASLYYHFPSKEDLCVAYMQRRADNWVNGLEEYLKNVDDPRERLVKTFDYRAIHLKNNQFGGCSYIKIISELPQRGEKIDEKVLGIKEKQRKFFHDLTRKLAGIEKKSAAVLADKIFLLFDGGTVQCQVYRDTAPLKIAKKAVMDLLDEYW